MEHRAAVDQRFTERYLLGEMSSDEVAAFEMHFFECALCADDVRCGARLTVNLKAVLHEAVRHETVYPGSDALIHIRSSDRFLDLTIPLDPLEYAPRIECEFHFEDSPALVALAALAGEDSIRLRLPTGRLLPGACTVMLRDKDSQHPLGQRKLLIANLD